MINYQNILGSVHHHHNGAASTDQKNGGATGLSNSSFSSMSLYGHGPISASVGNHHATSHGGNASSVTNGGSNTNTNLIMMVNRDPYKPPTVMSKMGPHSAMEKKRT